MSIRLPQLSGFVSFSYLALLSLGLTLSSGSKNFQQKPSCLLVPVHHLPTPELGAPLEWGPVY